MVRIKKIPDNAEFIAEDRRSLRRLTVRYDFAGYESSVKQWCPIPLLGTFSYTHDTGSVTTCGAGSVVSACPDWTDLRFNYSQCSTTQVFSGN